MANKEINKKEEVRNENIAATVSKTEQFYNENKKTIWGAVAVLVVIVLAILAYGKFVYQPKCAEAMGQAYPAEIAFQGSEWELALNGDGNVLGFAEVIENYGSKAGKAVYFYAGVCNLQLGNFEEALSYLNKYKGKDSILAARALACKGDAYVGLEEYKTAVTLFEKAAAKADNVFAAEYLLKAGVTYEALGENAKALDCYETIKDKYPQSIEGYDIDKYISRVSE